MGEGTAPQELGQRLLADAVPPERPSLLRTFVLLYLPLVALFVFMGRQTYFGQPMFELGDYAANALQIDKAEHLSELLGNYSRFGFHHPGPAFFYVYAAGDLLFRDLLHVAQAPANASLLAGLLLQVAFFALALAILASLVPAHRPTFLLCALAIAVVFFHLTGSPEFEIWPPYQLVLPFACFLSAAIAVALGWAAVLPIMVLCGGFLVHGHVAQPLFVVPIFAIAYVSLFAVSRQGPGLGLMRFLGDTARPHLWSVIVVFPFVLTLGLDALRGGQSNLTSILDNLAHGNPTPSWGRALFYVLEFLALRGRQAVGVLDVAPADRLAFLGTYWPALLGWLVVLIVPAIAVLRSRSSDDRPIVMVHGSAIGGRRFLITYYGLLCVGTLLTLVWAKNQQAELYAFNSFFFNGLLCVAALPVAFLAARAGVLQSRRARIGVVVVLLLVAVAQPFPFTGVTTLGGGPGDETGRELNDAAARMASQPGRPPPAILLRFQPDDWATVVGLALALERHGITYLVRPEWGFMFGYDHVYPGSPLVPPSQVPVEWRLAAPSPTATSQIQLSRGLVVVSVAPAGLQP
jgi:hypothetical protein